MQLSRKFSFSDASSAVTRLMPTCLDDNGSDQPTSIGLLSCIQVLDGVLTPDEYPGSLSWLTINFLEQRAIIYCTCNDHLNYMTGMLPLIRVICGREHGLMTMNRFLDDLQGSHRLYQACIQLVDTELAGCTTSSTTLLVPPSTL